MPYVPEQEASAAVEGANPGKFRSYEVVCWHARVLNSHGRAWGQLASRGSIQNMLLNLSPGAQVLQFTAVPPLVAAAGARAAAARARTNGAAAVGAKRKRSVSGGADLGGEDAGVAGDAYTQSSGDRDGPDSSPAPRLNSAVSAAKESGPGRQSQVADAGGRTNGGGKPSCSRDDGGGGDRGGGGGGGGEAQWGGTFEGELAAVLDWCGPRLAWAQLRAQLAYLGAPFDEEWALAAAAPRPHAAARGGMQHAGSGSGSGSHAQVAAGLPNGGAAANGAAAARGPPQRLSVRVPGGAADDGTSCSDADGGVDVPVLAAGGAPLQRALVVRGFDAALHALDAATHGPRNLDPAAPAHPVKHGEDPAGAPGPRGKDGPAGGGGGSRVGCRSEGSGHADCSGPPGPGSAHDVPNNESLGALVAHAARSLRRCIPVWGPVHRSLGVAQGSPAW